MDNIKQEKHLPENGYNFLPKNDHHWKKVSSFIEPIPQSDYHQAPYEAREAFRDMKYGIRIHWGIYSIWELKGESWPFLSMSFEQRHEYNQLYKNFNPVKFNADSWMEFFERAGFRCFTFTTKHHEGFSMFDTKTRVKQRINWLAPGGPKIEDCDLAYSIMDTPFKRDIVKEICDAARKRGIKIGLYFSHPDWYDADFRPYNYHPMMTPNAKELLIPGEFEEVMNNPKRNHVMGPNTTPEQTERMLNRHRAQLIELLTNYGPIDMLCLDQWMGPQVWPHMRETIKMLRKIQPHVMMRARGIGNYGDYYTPEGFVPGSKENTDMPWMVIYPLASSFSYDGTESNYKGAEWVIYNLVDTVAKGGNFMVGIGPDGQGEFHKKAVDVLEEAGEWLRINGEAIYSTRPRAGEMYKEGENIRYTRTKDNKHIYAIALQWPGEALNLKLAFPEAGSHIYLLGYDKPLEWNYSDNGGITVKMPEFLQDEKNRPCKYAYSFRIKNAEFEASE
ncbi:MAG: hypothetical protein GX094_07605 [Clostridiales bacterium]|nr:hypothetical protein [Clostridiales bacterium]